MQVNQVSHIELIWPHFPPYNLNILQNIHRHKPNEVLSLTQRIGFVGKPTHFIWHYPDARTVTQKMRNWVADVFPLIFNPSNKLLLFASIGTAPLELREQLKDLFNEQTIIHG